ncbi:hypothetical protein L9F63_019221, partial [Diploptera punctata]
VYKSLNIVTNKVTEEERRLAPHHLLDIVDPLQRFTVMDFRNRALPIIEDLMKIGKLPVIVGGTNYYIESLLWRILIEDSSEELKQENKSPIGSVDSKLESVDRKRIKLEDVEVDILDEAALEKISSQKLYEKLKSIDPDMADQLHPNNKRKIISI